MESAIFENMIVWTKDYEKRTPDQKTLELMETMWGTAAQRIPSTRQSGSEVSEMVKNMILSEKPNLRYQTNDKWGPDEVKVKLADPSGNATVDILVKNYLSKE